MTITTDTAAADQVAGQHVILAKAGPFIRAVQNVALFACTDDTLPAICAVHVTAADGVLTLEATDRYAIGTETLECEGSADFDRILSVKELAAAVKTFAQILRGDRYTEHDIMISAEDGQQYAALTLDGAGQPDTTLSVPAPADYAFPSSLGKMLAAARDGANELGDAAVIQLAAAHLAKLAKVKTGDSYPAPVRFRFTTSGKPAFFTIGETFAGMAMPIRIPA